MMRNYILVATLVIMRPAVAQVSSAAALLAGFVRSPQVSAVLANTLLRDEPAILRARCGVPGITGVSSYSIEQPPVFVREASGVTFQSGALIVRVVTTRCGAPAVRRILLARTPGAAKVITHALTPGEPPGNLKLEADTLRIVEPGVSAIAHCPVDAAIVPLDTQAIVPLGPKGGQERWIFGACGNVYSGDVVCTPILRNGVSAGMNVLGGNYRLIPDPL